MVKLLLFRFFFTNELRTRKNIKNIKLHLQLLTGKLNKQNHSQFEISLLK